MKICSLKRNLIVGLSLNLWFAPVVYAKGNFVPYPINCTTVDEEDRSVEIHVSIQNTSGVISGKLMDNGNLANIHCQEIATDIIEYNFLDCVGQWDSDGSEARFSTPLFTYVPMPTIQRSSSALGSKKAQGICTTK